MTNLQQLRIHAISHSLFQPLTLKAAIQRMGFVQADPIRSPARAQDLILRHRVKDYKAGDLERQYGSLDIEEDYLYAYGFLSRELWQLLHPRAATRLSKLDQKVLELVRAVGAMHSGHPEASFGGKRVINAWGGYSKATKQALERLHYGGFLRIAHRQKGIRVYEAVPDRWLSRFRRLSACKGWCLWSLTSWRRCRRRLCTRSRVNSDTDSQERRIIERRFKI